jgi:hypothetical protein
MLSNAMDEIEFRGLRGRADVLTWGQAWMYQVLDSLAPENLYVHIAAIIDMPGQRRISDVIDALRSLVELHESLRTRFSIDAIGSTHQEVMVGGKIPLRLADARGTDSSDIARMLRREISSTPFSSESVPIRAGIVIDGSTPRHVVLSINHLAADQWSFGIIQRDLLSMVDLHSRGLAASYKTPKLFPVDLAGYQRSDRGRAGLERSLDHWRHALTEFPESLFPDGPYPESHPRFCEALFESTILMRAIETLSNRLRITSPAVVTAGISLLLAHRVGLSGCGLLIEVGNRFDRTLQEMVTTLVQHGPVAVDTRKSCFSEIAYEVASAMLSAHRHGLYDPERLAVVRREVTERRGGDLEISCILNIMHDKQTPDPGLRESQGQPSATSLTWGAGKDYENVSLYIRVKGINSRPTIFIRADTRRFPKNEVEMFLFKLERLLSRAVEDNDVSKVLGD